MLMVLTPLLCVTAYSRLSPAFTVKVCVVSEQLVMAPTDVPVDTVQVIAGEVTAPLCHTVNVVVSLVSELATIACTDRDLTVHAAGV